MGQGGKIVQRKIVPGGDLKLLADFAEELRLLDTVDSQVGFQVGVHFDKVFGVARLLDDEPNQKLSELFDIRARRLLDRCAGLTRGRLAFDHGGRWDAVNLGHRRCHRCRTCGAEFLDEEIEHMGQGGKIVQRKIVPGGDLKLLADFAEELRLLDTVDSQVGFQVGVHFDKVFRISGLLDDEPHQKLPELFDVRSWSCSRCQVVRDGVQSSLRARVGRRSSAGGSGADCH